MVGDSCNIRRKSRSWWAIRWKYVSRHVYCRWLDGYYHWWSNIVVLCVRNTDTRGVSGLELNGTIFSQNILRSQCTILWCLNYNCSQWFTMVSIVLSVWLLLFLVSSVNTCFLFYCLFQSPWILCSNDCKSAIRFFGYTSIALSTLLSLYEWAA